MAEQRPGSQRRRWARLWAGGIIAVITGLWVTVQAATTHEDIAPRSLRLAAGQLGPDYRYDIRQVDLSGFSMRWSSQTGLTRTYSTVTVLVRARKQDNTQFMTFSWNQ
jgi:hypothetical protein